MSKFIVTINIIISHTFPTININSPKILSYLIPQKKCENFMGSRSRARESWAGDGPALEKLLCRAFEKSRRRRHGMVVFGSFCGEEWWIFMVNNG